MGLDPMNFRQMLDVARRKGRTKFDKPRPMSDIAELVGVSNKHLYNLGSGTRVAPEWTVEKIAAGLGLKAADVQAALDRSVEEAGAA